jgi:capsular polysaccharide biosynthesis protein
VANKKSEFSLFFVPEFMESYHRESLQAIGLKESQMISLNNTYKVDNMSLIERLAPSGNYNDAVMNELSKLIKDKLGLVDKKPFRKIYISREKAKTRKVLNEIDIIKEVQQLGFETIYLEDLSFKEQVQLFSESIVVISIHGGGLTNMMFMQPRAKVLEIRKEGDATNLCYYSLANAYDLDYYYLFGQPNDPNKSVQAADLDVSVSELKYIINEFF